MTEKTSKTAVPFGRNKRVKYAPFVITAILIIVSVLAGDWAIRMRLLKDSQGQLTAPVSITPHPTLPVIIQTRMNAWQEFQNARAQALRDNPDLAAEYQELRTEMQQQQNDLNAAMINADPRVAPLLAKLESLHPSFASPGSAPVNPSAGITK